MSAHAASHRIRNVSIRGGSLDGAQFELADRLNCFIGARGAGKTTVVELIRYALDALPSRETQPLDRRRIETLVERNLAGGRVDVTIEIKDGLLYVVSRMAGEEPLVLTPENEPTDVTLESAGVFRADIYSQNEVESIADRTACQLDLLDSFAADRINELQTQIAQVHTELAAIRDRGRQRANLLVQYGIVARSDGDADQRVLLGNNGRRCGAKSDCDFGGGGWGVRSAEATALDSATSNDENSNDQTSLRSSITKE